MDLEQKVNRERRGIWKIVVPEVNEMKISYTDRVTNEEVFENVNQEKYQL